MSRRKAGPSHAARLVAWIFKVVVAAIVVAIPLVGMWTASSLAAYRGGRVGLAVLAGLVAFPILPLVWDLASEVRRKRRGDSRPRILTFGDRLLLRTFVINFTLLVGLLATRPALAFTALSTRGDWMLDGRGPRYGKVRRALFKAAQGLEWLYTAAHRNRFEKMVDSRGGKRPVVRPKPQKDQQLPADQGKSNPSPSAPGWTWPEPAELHAAVAHVPPEVEKDYVSVAHYLRDREPDPLQRVKALHDWIADRIAYDAPAYVHGDIPDQSADAIFRTRKSVCAGYSNLFKAMADVTGDEAVVVIGDARRDIDDVGGLGHAWNAVKISGEWRLLDVTWDAGYVTGETFEKRYQTEYFLTPPAVFGVNHFPQMDSWQLRSPAITRGDFMRQPMLSPSFYANGFRLLSPDRSQVTVTDALDIGIENPRGRFVLADIHAGVSDPTPGHRCDVSGEQTLHVHCALPGPGVFRVQLFANEERQGTFEHVGAFEAVRSE